MGIWLSVERIYGQLTRVLFKSINPFKKMMIKTEAKVHKFNNQQAILLLKSYGYKKAYHLFATHLFYLNLGTVWADQDFKSSGHFYNPVLNKGLFGQPHAKKLVKDYYKKAMDAWHKGAVEQSMFYLGACVHIIQDMTVPHHVVIRLLNRHRSYETFVKLTFDLVEIYRTEKPPILLGNIEAYMDYNAKKSLNLYKKYGSLKNRKQQFHCFTQMALPLAHRTSAGCFLTFLKEVGFY